MHVIHKVDRSTKAFETNDGLWHLTMFCGAALPLVSEKTRRPWTHEHNHLVTCSGCVAKLQREPMAATDGPRAAGETGS